MVLAFKAPEPNAVLVAIAPAPLPTRTPDRVASVVEEIAPVTASAPEFTAASVEVPDADSVVNAPDDAVEAPTLVPLIVPPVIVTLASASASIALFSSARVIFFIDVAEVSYIKKTSSAAVAEPVIALSAPGLALASDSLAKG